MLDFIKIENFCTKETTKRVKGSPQNRRKRHQSRAQQGINAEHIKNTGNSTTKTQFGGKYRT